MPGKTFRPAFAGLVLLLLTACGSSGPAELPNLAIPDVRTSVMGDNVLLGMAFAILDPAYFVPTSLDPLSLLDEEVSFSPQSMTEIDDGFYIGMLADVDNSGTATLSLPDPDDIPADAIVPAADSFWLLSRAPDCTVAVEPSGVQMSISVFLGSGYPGFAGLIMRPTGETLFAQAVASDQALDLDNPPTAYVAYQWIYSDGEAVVSFEGTDCGPFSASQVEFAEGWNVVGWNIDTGAAELVNAAEPGTLYLTVEDPVTIVPAASSDR